MINPRANSRLDSLTAEEFNSIESELKLVSLESDRIISEPNEPFGRFYFPLTAKIAMCMSRDGLPCVDVGVIGSDGMVGLRALLKSRCYLRLYVTSPGLAYQIPVAPILHEYRKFGGIYDMCMMAYQDNQDKIVTEIACDHYHSIEQRVACWVLRRTELPATTEIITTHQKIANSLGCKREAVTLALRQFQGIELSRGKITVHDRGWMERACCSCYAPPFQTADHQMNIWSGQDY